jgi:hypothetical protein
MMVIFYIGKISKIDHKNINIIVRSKIQKILDKIYLVQLVMMAWCVFGICAQEQYKQKCK